MNDEPNELKRVRNSPYVIVALIAGVLSFLLAVFALFIMPALSDAGMWAVVAMVATPSAMGVGIAYFMSKQPPRQ
jgi:hypothetical protein